MSKKQPSRRNGSVDADLSPQVKRKRNDLESQGDNDEAIKNMQRTQSGIANACISF